MKTARLGPEASGRSAGGSGGRRWEDLPRDILVKIFGKLSLLDLIVGVPFACSSWRGAAMDPSFWRDLDFGNWGSVSRLLYCTREGFRSLLRFSVACSAGSLRSVRFPRFADAIDLLYVAERCPELRYFSLESAVPMDKFCDAINKLKSLEGMAVHESLISHVVLQRINQCCMHFSELKVFAEVMDKNMASAISKWLPHLRKLETPHCYIGREVIITFLDELKELEYLDISGKKNSGIVGVVLKKASRLKVFQWDSKYDLGQFLYCPNCDEDRFSSDHCMCAADRYVLREELEEFSEYSWSSI